MSRSTSLLCILAGLILTIASCSSFNQVVPSDNIGCVVYVKNPDGSGNLLADWAYSSSATTTVQGTGYTTQSPESQDFAGKYKIIYTGTRTDSFTLVVQQVPATNASSFYKVQWLNIQTGALVYYGTGIEKDNQLIVGWRK